MIKSAIKHSAIRSPFRKPFVPVDDGYREYLKRSVFELNGTQWGELSEPVVLDGDCYGRFLYYAPEPAALYKVLFGGFWTSAVNRPFSVAYSNSGKIQVGFGTSSSWESVTSSNSLLANEINLIEFQRVGDSLGVAINGDWDYLPVQGSTPSETTTVASSTQPGYEAFGIVYDLKIWTNGDSHTGDLILNVPFDESGSDYQRNHAVALGVELSDLSLVTEGLPEFSVTGDNILSKTSTGAGTAFVCAVEAGKKYRVRYKKNAHDAGSPNFRDEFGNQLAFPIMQTSEEVSAYYEFIFEAVADGLAGFNGNLSIFTVSDISIREWSGVILQSALPEDWMQIEKKRWWDFWVGVENVFSADVVAGFWQELPGDVYTIDGTQTGNNDIRTDSAMTVGGTYIFAGLCEDIVGTFAFRAGPNEILIIESDGSFEAELTAEIVDIVLRAQPGSSGTFSKLSVRRKLEIAS